MDCVTDTTMVGYTRYTIQSLRLNSFKIIHWSISKYLLESEDVFFPAGARLRKMISPKLIFNNPRSRILLLSAPCCLISCTYFCVSKLFNKFNTTRGKLHACIDVFGNLNPNSHICNLIYVTTEPRRPYVVWFQKFKVCISVW